MLKYDNCKNCHNANCEHYGKDREFVCPGGISCKVAEPTNYSEQARTVVEAIRTFAEHPGRLDNFESYLANCFGPWVKKFANNPDGIAAELKYFSEIE